MEKIGLGVIGAGTWGEAHARIFSTHPDARLVAVCDVAVEKARDIAGKYGASRTYSDFHELVRDRRFRRWG